MKLLITCSTCLVALVCYPAFQNQVSNVVYRFAHCRQPWMGHRCRRGCARSEIPPDPRPLKFLVLVSKVSRSRG
jgi:hypothetical protein